MQYEPGLSRKALIELATKTYFGNVDAKNMEAALACFHEGALFCVQTDFTRHQKSSFTFSRFRRAGRFQPRICPDQWRTVGE